MLTSKRRIRVGWGDCDPAGIVFYPRYFEWFEECTTALFDAAGFSMRALREEREIIGVPLVDARAQFRKPSAFGDEIEAESKVIEWRNSSFVVSHRFFNAGDLAVEGSEIRVWTGRDPRDANKMKSRPIPREIIEAFSRPGGG